MTAPTQPIRLRIAPSPTGDPHVGLAYTTLFNYVFCKQNNGKLVLRIEDTDRERAKPSSEANIMSSLKWLGLQWDEGPDIGGPYGPYRQSERQAIYVQHVHQLLESGKAYRCFCSSARLDTVRTEQRAKGLTTGYDRHCRELSAPQVEAQLQAQASFVVRMKVPLEGKTDFVDTLRGVISIDNHQVDDQVILKADGFPTYHLANVVDDHLMKISHVIRAEEWISSTPKHVLLYAAFGWSAPVFLHLPLLRNPDKSKISKRKNPVSLTYYQRKGILPAAMLNFLALMGWSYSETQEIFTVAEMQEKFVLEKIHLGSPIFDMQKLLWLNQHYLQQVSEEEFVAKIREEVFSESYLRKLYPLLRSRLDCWESFVEKADFFFTGALSYQGLGVCPTSMPQADFSKGMESLLLVLDDVYQWDCATIEAALNQHRESLQWKPKDYFMPLRLIVTGRKDSPPLVETLEVLGREMVRFRIRNYLQNI